MHIYEVFSSQWQPLTVAEFRSLVRFNAGVTYAIVEALFSPRQCYFVTFEYTEFTQTSLLCFACANGPVHMGR